MVVFVYRNILPRHGMKQARGPQRLHLRQLFYRPTLMELSERRSHPLDRLGSPPTTGLIPD